jgi:hypothetical protein
MFIVDAWWLQGLIDRILLLQLFLFAASGDVSKPQAKAEAMSRAAANEFASSSYPVVGSASIVMDPLCCNQSRTLQPFYSAGQSFALVNGGYQPTINLTVRSLHYPLPANCMLLGR